MKKKTLAQNRPTIAILIALILLSFGAVARAGMFNWLTDSPIPSTPSTSNALAYLSSSPATLTIVDQPLIPINEQFITIQDNYIVQPATPNSKSNPIIVRSELVVVATGYSSTPDQTDDSPFITAMGSTVRDGVVAANFLPFGTKLKIPSHYGDKVFVVEDRMNPRYDQRIDLWFPDRASAKQFGLRTVKIQVLGK